MDTVTTIAGFSITPGPPGRVTVPLSIIYERGGRGREGELNHNYYAIIHILQDHMYNYNYNCTAVYYSQTLLLTINNHSVCVCVCVCLLTNTFDLLHFIINIHVHYIPLSIMVTGEVAGVPNILGAVGFDRKTLKVS